MKLVHRINIFVDKRDVLLLFIWYGFRKILSCATGLDILRTIDILNPSNHFISLGCSINNYVNFDDSHG
jgi:hypothetical protein